MTNVDHRLLEIRHIPHQLIRIWWLAAFKVIWLNCPMSIEISAAAFRGEVQHDCAMCTVLRGWHNLSHSAGEDLLWPHAFRLNSPNSTCKLVTWPVESKQTIPHAWLWLVFSLTHFQETAHLFSVLWGFHASSVRCGEETEQPAESSFVLNLPLGVTIQAWSRASHDRQKPGRQGCHSVHKRSLWNHAMTFRDLWSRKQLHDWTATMFERREPICLCQDPSRWSGVMAVVRTKLTGSRGQESHCRRVGQ